MGKLLFFPGCAIKQESIEIPQSYSELLEWLATEILKEISVTFVENRVEMGPASMWYDEVMSFLQERHIPERAVRSSLLSALRDYKYYWREEALVIVRTM